MKRITTFFAMMICAIAMMANPVEPQQAQTVARHFMMRQMPAVTRSTECTLAYTKSNGRSDALFYVYNVGGGFVIVSADDAVKPVLGYSTTGSFDPQNIPSNCAAWLQNYADQIALVKEHNLSAPAEVSTEWTKLVEGREPTRSGNTRAVAPLLTTTWDQSPWYNSLCPGTGNDQAITGCEATAMAQIINYHQWPAQGFGSHLYYHEDYGTLAVNFSSHTYHYDLMPNELNSNSTSAQVNAVATLMRDCGIAVNMGYGPDASSAFTTDARAALIDYFGYEAKMALRDYKSFGTIIGSYNNLIYYNDDEWKAMLKNELDAHNPILYDGTPFDLQGGGHAFVCDGYDANDYFHFNWGWSGWYNGYYAVGNVIPAGADTSLYPSNNIAVFCHPNTSGIQKYIFNSEGRSSMTVHGSLDISHQLGYNGNYTYGSNWGEYNGDTLVLYPQTADAQLLLQKVAYTNNYSDRWRIYVYDGVGTEGTLLMTIENSNQQEPVMSTSGTLTLVVSGAGTVSNELLLRVTEVSCMPPVFGFACIGKTFATADLSWEVFHPEEYTGFNFNWRVEYGPHGFTPGTGTIVPATTTSVTISGLTAETEYDAYLSYSCSGSGIQTLGPIIFKTEKVMACFEEPFVQATSSTYSSEVAFNIGYSDNYHWSQQLFTAAELSSFGLQAGDEITALSFQYRTNYTSSTSKRRNIALYMGHTTKAAFSSNTDWFAPENLVNVYTEKEEVFKIFQNNEWKKFDFDNTFVWDGHSNVVVAVADNGDYCDTYINFASNGGESNSTLYATSAYPLTSEHEGYLSNMRASIRLCLATDCPVPTHLTHTDLNRHSVRLEWLPGYQETLWNAEYGPAGFERGTGTFRTISGMSSLIATHLSSGYYDFYVQADCGGGATSEWVKTTIPVGSFDCAQMGEGQTIGTNDGHILPMGYSGGDYSAPDCNNCYCYYCLKYTYTQQIYTAAELAEQGLAYGDNIQSLSFHYSGTPQTKSPVSVWMGNTLQNNLTSTTWIPASSMQEVFSGEVTLDEEWVTIVFSNPFLWDGTSNIVVAFLNNSGNDNDSFSSTTYKTDWTARAIYGRSNSFIDIENPSDIRNITTTSYRNNLRFCKSTNCAMRRDMEVTINEGGTYDFYGTPVSEQGIYQHRWYVNDECDSLVVLHLIVRKVIFVTSTGEGLHDGTSWENAMELQEAMDIANTFTDVTPYLYVKAETYTGNTSADNSYEIKPNVRAYGGFVGNEPADYDLSNRTQANINNTILYGSGSRRVLYQSADFTEATATLFDGFCIRGGSVNTVGSGGGAYIRKYCTLQNCVITNNISSISGSESNVTRNGVAVYNDGGTLSNCTIHTNRIDLSGTGSGHKVYGVGVYNKNGIIEGCDIRNNLSKYESNGDNWNTYGGGIYDYQNSTIRNTSVTRNSAATGGGIYHNNYSSSVSQVTNCVISNNTARTNGGGVCTDYNGTITYTQCLIGNNEAGSNGGGVSNSNRNIRFIACDIVRNSAVSKGGGFYTSSACTLQNSIVWGNKVGANDNQLATNSSNYFTMENSAVQGGYSGAITLEKNNSGTGVGYPLFTSPTTEAGVDVGNVIGDWTLQAGSICANLGRNIFVEDIDTDLGGNTRIQQERADIGAYESEHDMAFPLHPEANNNIIYVTTTGAGSQDGSSWGNATANLQYAMDVAMGCEPPAMVWVANGTYTPGHSLITQPKVAVYGSFEGNEPYPYDLDQRDFSVHATIVDGDSAYRVLDKSCPFDEGNGSLFDGLTFRNGFVTSTSDYSGAYLLANTDLLNCTFSGNHRYGVWAKDCRIDHCTFDGNKGYGLRCEGGTNVSNSTAQNNNNYGIYFNSTGTLSNSTMRQNRSSGLYITTGTVKECVIENNGSSNYGVYSDNASVQIFNTSITNNNGGGLYTNGGLYVNVNIANNTTTNNSYNSAAGISARNHSRFVNCNIVNNKSTSSNSNYCRGGIYNYSTDNEYTNCIIWGNKAMEEAGNIYGDGTFTYCAVEGGLDATGNITLESANNGGTVGVNYVRFVNPTAEAGISTQEDVDYHLASGSACINAGNSSNTSLNLPTYDLGGSLRIKQNRIDIGAYEFGDVTIQTIDSSICLGSSFSYNNGEYFVYPEAPGLFKDTIIYYEGGTDYIVYLNLQVNPKYNIRIDTAICQGESYFFDGQYYTTPVTRTAHLETVAGCDSTVTLILSINPIVYGEFHAEACDSFHWYDSTYYETGDYEQVLQAATGCDSIVTLHLTVHHSVTTVDSMMLCRSALPYYYQGMIIDEDAPEHDTIPIQLSTVHDCDSTVFMRFTIMDVITTEFSIDTCDLYVWNGVPYTTSGNKEQTFTASTGCDSIVTLHLTIRQSNTFQFDDEACYLYRWNESTYEESGDYQQVFTNAAGCDSTVTLHLTIYQAVFSDIFATTCQNELPYHYINGQIDTIFGTETPHFSTFDFHFSTSHGCDSTVTLHLTVNPSYSIPLEAIICQNELPYHYINGQIDTIFGTETPELSVHNFHLSTMDECDSLITLTLTVIPVSAPQLVVDGQVTACESGSATLSVEGSYTTYTWSTGATTPTLEVSAPGFYWVSLTDTNGCSSITEVTQLGGSELIPEIPAICMVGVENGHNLVVWEEIENTNVQNYRIYRENDQANVYELLATVPASQGNSYEDITADPTVRAWRYKVTAMDVCQGETPMSELHKTVHLTINRGIGNSWNLIWTHYEGFEFSSYKLYRGTANNNLEEITTIPSTLTSYTDYDNVDGALFYQIEVVMSSSCLRRSETYTGARSNIVYNGEAVYIDTNVTACVEYEWYGTNYHQSGTYLHDYTSPLGYDVHASLHLTIVQPPAITITGNTSITAGQSTTLTATFNSQCSYLWSTGATTNSITVSPTETTTYYVTVTYGPCELSTGETVTVTTGVAEWGDGILNLYPNPTNSTVTLQLTPETCTLNPEIQIFDIYGQRLQIMPVRDERTQIDLSHYATGIYLIKLVNDGKVMAVRKAVKQ
ncbi:MAG: C10 family peptidase [Bacteroidales bacterium]|nr:C10 family peptidase [Bacteroidales bacterium]